VVLAAGRSLVPRLGRWPRVAARAVVGPAGVHARRVAAMAALSLVGWGCELVMLVLFQSAFHLDPASTLALLTLVGIKRRHRHPDLARQLRHLRSRRHDGLVMCGAPRDVAVLYG